MTAPPTGPPRPDGLRLIETMRAEGGAVALLGLHLARLAASADALDFALDPDAARRAVERAVERGGGGGAHVVRLTLGRGGDVAVEPRPLDAAPFQTAWVDPEPFAEAGTWRTAHKTTARAAYRARADRARAWCRRGGPRQPARFRLGGHAHDRLGRAGRAPPHPAPLRRRTRWRVPRPRPRHGRARRRGRPDAGRPPGCRPRPPHERGPRVDAGPSGRPARAPSPGAPRAREDVI